MNQVTQGMSNMNFQAPPPPQQWYVVNFCKERERVMSRIADVSIDRLLLYVGLTLYISWSQHWHIVLIMIMFS